ncbi:DUF4426 domain-containing protein [Vibrio agarilyticus]|nr:DUF4426 domain-containing protein [Vibrio agarilyticus]
MRTILLGLILFFSATTLHAEQFQTLKDVEVHYVAFNSTFLTPKIARSYGIKRNGYTGLINVSVLDTRQAGKPAVAARIQGQAKNLLGQTQTLAFEQVQEGEAIYYLAQLPISHEEIMTITLNVDAGLKGSGNVSFTQKFYVEP